MARASESFTPHAHMVGFGDHSTHAPLHTPRAFPIIHHTPGVSTKYFDEDRTPLRGLCCFLSIRSICCFPPPWVSAACSNLQCAMLWEPRSVGLLHVIEEMDGAKGFEKWTCSQTQCRNRSTSALRSVDIEQPLSPCNPLNGANLPSTVLPAILRATSRANPVPHSRGGAWG